MTLSTLAAWMTRVKSFRSAIEETRNFIRREKFQDAPCIPLWLGRRWCTVDVLSRSDGRGLPTLLIKSQMNDISGAIISYRYYRDGYYVSCGARARSLSFVPPSLSRSPRIFLPLASSPVSPLSLSISLLLLRHLLSLWKRSYCCMQGIRSLRCKKAKAATTRESAD